MPARCASVVVPGRALAVHRHVLPLVAFGQVPDRRGSGRFGQSGRLPALMRVMMRAASLRACSADNLSCRPTVTRFEVPKARLWTT